MRLSINYYPYEQKAFDREQKIQEDEMSNE